VSPLIAVVAMAFAALGGAAERLASVWPEDEASRRAPGPRTVALALAAGAAGGAVVWRSALPWWATAIHLVMLALLVVLSATDLEQRRLPHLALDPLVVLGVAFVFVNPSTDLAAAAIGGVGVVAFLGLLGLVVRGGVALGDLYLVLPMGLTLGWPAIFAAVFVGAVLSAVTSLALLATRRVSLGSYIPFGPFLVAGYVITLIRDTEVLGLLVGR
jgi:leader peptidase (prepilin peptidase)/N-methyltransferase